jgi:hypothetical protein
MKIAILITTFLRDDLLYNTVKKAIEYSNDDCFILIGDQNPTCIKANFLEELSGKLAYYSLPYDCGLSYARNRLVEVAKTLECDYILLIADSLQLCKPLPPIEHVERLFNQYPDVGIIGFSINGRKPHPRNIDLIPGKYFYQSIPQNLPYCDMVSNFFIAKIRCLLDNPWDENLKLCEHEDFFWRLKTKTPWKVIFNNTYSCDYVKDRSPEYNAMRVRLYGEFQEILRKKYNISEWWRNQSGLY